MLDGLDFPSGDLHPPPRGLSMPTAREWARIDRDRAEADLYRRAAAWLRTDPRRHESAGLQDDATAQALAALLDMLAGDVAGLDRAVRWQARESCRVLLGETMASPMIRRTRRR
jgi:hypothetical protein